jgi:hypothetical protein
MRERLRRWLASAGQLALSAGLLWMGLDLAHAQSAPAPTTTATVDAAATARSAPAAWARRCCPRAWNACAAPRR